MNLIESVTPEMMEAPILAEPVVRRILADLRVVLTDDHFAYTSGKHGSAYVNKDALYPHTRETSGLCHLIAAYFANLVRQKRCNDPDAVVAPAVGGVALSQWVAHRLGEFLGHTVLALYAEKENDGTFVLKRGYDKLVAGKRVLVVEDVLNTGGSARAVVVAVRAAGGAVVGVGALCNRGGVTTQDLHGVPELFALVDVPMDAWDEADCPLCKSGIPINVEVGHGKKFLAQKAAQAREEVQADIRDMS